MELTQLIAGAGGIGPEKAKAVIRALRKGGFVIINAKPTPDEAAIAQEVTNSCVEAKCKESGAHAWKQVAAAGRDMMTAALGQP